MLKVALNGVNQVREEMEQIQKQIPFATALALNNTAQLVKAEIEREMSSVFDRPTKWTLNSMFLTPAKKAKLEASVWVKDKAAGKNVPPAQWMLPGVEGGTRQEKASESSLRAFGALPTGKYIMPGKGVKLDRFGNISRGTMSKVLASVKSGGAQPVKSSKTARKNKYFVLGRGSNAVGIAERTSKRSIKMVLAFGSRPSYSRRLDFYGIGQRVADKHLVSEFEKAIAFALKHSSYRTEKGGKLRQG